MLLGKLCRCHRGEGWLTPCSTSSEILMTYIYTLSIAPTTEEWLNMSSARLKISRICSGLC
jgi:hypothetical protein